MCESINDSVSCFFCKMLCLKNSRDSVEEHILCLFKFKYQRPSDWSSRSEENYRGGKETFQESERCRKRQLSKRPLTSETLTTSIAVVMVSVSASLQRGEAETASVSTVRQHFASLPPNDKSRKLHRNSVYRQN